MSDMRSAFPPPESFDPAAAEEAFNALRDRLLALPQEKVAQLHIDISRAAFAAATLGRMVQDPAMRARFAKLPADEFDQAHVDDLERIALAAWHASQKLLAAAEGSVEAKLPISLVQRATFVKNRMLALVEYQYGDDPIEGIEVASIKQGSGYADLASDLIRLARFYKKHHAVIERDPKNFVASDTVYARRYAQEILQLLGEGRNQEEKTWADLVGRAWTLLVEAHGEVSAAGRWLYRHEGGEARFPSLYGVVRADLP